MANRASNPLEEAVDQAMDAFFYAPIGLFFEGPALFPKLVAKGRDQVQAARMVGKLAVQMGQTEAEKRMASAEGPLRDLLVALGMTQPSGPPPGAQPEPTVATTKTTKASASSRTRKAAPKTAQKSAGRPVETPAATSLGIPDYDSLAASQVVKRLRGMDPADLEAVRAYEAATRARKTILNRITQIQKG